MSALKFNVGDIKKIDIVNTKGMTAREIQNVYHPDAFINLALYDMSTKENITYLEDENVSSGYLFSEDGIGIMGDKQLIWCNKGMAMGSDEIRDYVSGSPVLVQHGTKKIAWGNKYSDYVDKTHLRSAVGFTKDSIVLYTSTVAESLDQLASTMCELVPGGWAINCDGGGSCHLQQGDRVYTKSSRANASWLLIYLNKKEETPMQKKVVIDYGHLKNDSGTVWNGVREVDLNVDVADAIVNRLRANGINVLTTSGTLAARCEAEKSFGADLFVSVHHNSSKEHTGDGSEVHIYSKANPSLGIAEDILDNIVSRGLNNSRGVKVSPDLYVLRNTRSIALLVECAFIDNQDYKAVDTKAKREAMGVAIADAILSYFGIEAKEEPVKTTKLNLNGTIVDVPAILIDGRYYMQLRSLECDKLKIGYKDGVPELWIL